MTSRSLSAQSLALAFVLGTSFLTESVAHAQAKPAAQSGQPAQVSAQQKAEAARHFKRGLELFDENDYQGALIEFERAYQIAPTYQVLYNIGQVDYQLQDYAGALKSFERFLAEGGDKVPADRRADLERDIAKLRARLASVEITSTPGATIYVDDTAVGTAPLSAPVQVSTGRRRLRAIMAGRTPAEKTLELAGGDSLKIDLTLEAPAVVQAQGPTQPVEARPGTPWALWTTAGVLVVGAAVTGGIALSASSKSSNIRDNGGSFSDYDDAQKSMRTFSIVTDVLGGVAIVVVGIATYFTIANAKKSSAASLPATFKGLQLGAAPSGSSGGGLRLAF